ncbi:MAG: PIG-L family deacetylase [Actinomycetota bacterium]|jgi:LmbE family N-acetylglucosaminyl deacetylase|nr:PIG-L family deacetylase [Actinomycetota bacterium]
MGAQRRGGRRLTERWAGRDGLQRALVVAAHPDDVDFGAAGTVAVWTDSGVEVAYCIVTDGDAGGSDRSMPRAEMGNLRRGEQRAAAAHVGVGQVTFLGYPDGRVEPGQALRGDLTRLVRTFRPQLVLAPSPERWWDRIAASHPDHLAVGEAATCTVYPDARNPFAHPELLDEGLEPHTVEELWLMASPTPNLVVEVTAAFDRKAAALRCHRSQMPDPAGVVERVRASAAEAARAAGMPKGALAEVFQRVSTR